jgi:hypothetical protein
MKLGRGQAFRFSQYETKPFACRSQGVRCLAVWSPDRRRDDAMSATAGDGDAIA